MSKSKKILITEIKDAYKHSYANIIFSLTNYVERLKAEVADLKDVKTCEWKLLDEESVGNCTYETSCGGVWSFVEDGIEGSDTIYCYRCGKKIIETKTEITNEHR